MEEVVKPMNAMNRILEWKPKFAAPEFCASMIREKMKASFV